MFVLTSASGKIVWKHAGWLPVSALKAAARRSDLQPRLADAWQFLRPRASAPGGPPGAEAAAAPTRRGQSMPQAGREETAAPLLGQARRLLRKQMGFLDRHLVCRQRGWICAKAEGQVLEGRDRHRPEPGPLPDGRA